MSDFYDGTKSKEYKTKDGKQIYELYDENAELERKEVRYKNPDNKDVLEVHSGGYISKWFKAIYLKSSIRFWFCFSICCVFLLFVFV